MSYILSSRIFATSFRGKKNVPDIYYHLQLSNARLSTSLANLIANTYNGTTSSSSTNSRFFKYRSSLGLTQTQISSLSCSHCLHNKPHDSYSKTNGLSLPEKIVGAAPESWQPYLKLSRMHRPIGTWLLFWPCTWGLTLGSHGMPSITVLSLFGLGAFIMRGAGCTINDMWDRHIDAKVKRTVDRPLACGQLRMRHAAVWLGSQLSIALAILCHLNEPCFILGVGSLGLVILYPLAKRVTNWPQGVLGLTFNTGVIMGYTATQSSNLGYFAAPWLDTACIAFYLSGLSWTLIYDTIYAHQDKEDDALLGLGSTARKFGDNTKYWLSGFTVTMISSLSVAGIASDLSWPYYAGVAVTAGHLLWQIQTLDINNHQNCADRFTSNRHIGWLIFLSLLGSYWLEKEKPLPELVSKKELLA